MAPTTRNAAGSVTGGARDRLTRQLDGPDHNRNRRALQDRSRCPRWEHQVRRCHALGPRPMAELLAEIADRTGEAEFIAARVEAYAKLEPETVRAVGGAEFPPMPLARVA